jgi:hypothetical protein
MDWRWGERSSGRGWRCCGALGAGSTRKRREEGEIEINPFCFALFMSLIFISQN